MNFEYPRDVSIDQDQSTLWGGETARSRKINYMRMEVSSVIEGGFIFYYVDFNNSIL